MYYTYMTENRTEDVVENEVVGVRSWKGRREQRGQRERRENYILEIKMRG